MDRLLEDKRCAHKALQMHTEDYHKSHIIERIQYNWIFLIYTTFGLSHFKSLF